MFSQKAIETVEIEVLIAKMKILDHDNQLNLEVPITDELQSYNILKNDLYKRFKALKEVLDEKKRSTLEKKGSSAQIQQTNN